MLRGVIDMSRLEEDELVHARQGIKNMLALARDNNWVFLAYLLALSLDELNNITAGNPTHFDC
jgi:hypothetical protein